MTKKKFPENSLKRTIQEQTVYVEPKTVSKVTKLLASDFEPEQTLLTRV